MAENLRPRPFDLHPLYGLRRHDIRFLGRGSEHAVYESLELPNKVLKISLFHLGQAPLNSNVAQRLLPGMQSEDAQQAVEYLEAYYPLRYMHLNTCFGAQHVLPETYKIVELPLTGAMCRQLWNQAAFGDAETRWFTTIAKHQERAWPLDDPQAYQVHDMQSGYVELEPVVNEEAYNYACRRWIELEDRHEPFNALDMQVLLDLHGTPAISSLADMSHDRQFRENLADFIRRAMRFSADSGQPLDLQGKHNVIFFKDVQPSTSWNYLLLDVLTPIDETHLLQLPGIFQKITLGKRVERQERSALINTLGYVRVMNAFAHLLGLGERLDIWGGGPVRQRIWPDVLRQAAQFKPLGVVFPTQFYAVGESA